MAELVGTPTRGNEAVGQIALKRILAFDDGGKVSPAIGVFLVIPFLIELTVGVLVIVAWVQVLKKAGYSGWWVLIGLVPLVNLVMFMVFAFSDWPNLRPARGARYYGGGAYGARRRPLWEPRRRPLWQPGQAYGVGATAGVSHPVLDGWDPTHRPNGNDGTPPWAAR